MHTYIPECHGGEARDFDPGINACILTFQARFYTHTYIHIYKNTGSKGQIHRGYTHTYILTHTYIYTCTHTYIDIYMHTGHLQTDSTYIHTYIHTNTHRITGKISFIHTYIHTNKHS